MEQHGQRRASRERRMSLPAVLGWVAVIAATAALLISGVIGMLGKG